MKIDTDSLRLDTYSNHLQSMRGLAALAVLVGHCFITLPHGRIENVDFKLTAGNAILAAGELLIQPNSAVVFFYVLSGFVLQASLLRRLSTSSSSSLLSFFLRRLFRLLPAMWASVALSACVFYFLPLTPIDGATAFHNSQLGKVITARIVLTDAFAVTNILNPVLWSIQVEIVMIFFIPIMLWVSQRLSPMWNCAAVSILCLISILLWNPSSNAMRFAYCFYLGIALPQITALPIVYRLMLDWRFVLTALVLNAPLEYLYVTGIVWLPYKFIFNALVSAQIIAFIISAQSMTTVKWLERPTLVWLGDISFSFYAFSFPIQIAIATLIIRYLLPVGDAGATALTLFITASTGIVTALLAKASYEWIEKPFISLGRRY